MGTREYWSYDEIIDSLNIEELKVIVKEASYIEGIADDLIELADIHQFYDLIEDEDFEYDRYKDSRLD